MGAWHNVLGGVRVAGSGRAGERESGRDRSAHITHTHERSLTRPRTRHTRQYTTQKSKKNTPERIEMKKYNKYLRRHTLHREIK